jgi:endo-1,4-beta-xylanase
MKPVFLCGTEPGAYNADNIALAKRMIDAAKAKGIKFHGHCLMWHGQIAPWQSAAYFGSLSNEEVLTLLREYITDIVTEFKGRVHSWDVLNEAFNDGGSGDWRTAIRTANPWYSKLGADFVYEGFVAARKADPDALLYYNDYNLDNIGKATMVYNMTRDLNLRYSVEHPEDGRHLIDGIGMQGHENSGVPAANVRAGIALFRQLGVLISISEFDVLAHTYSDYEQSRPVTIQNRLNQANQFRDYFKVFLDNADIIERITFWGNSDVNSWRARSEPLPFTTVEEKLKAKPAFYRMVESLDME